MDKLKPPKYIKGDALKIWKDTAPTLERELEIGLVTSLDVGAFTLYCKTMARWIEAESILDEKGLTFKTPSGYLQQRPEVSISKQAQTAALKLATQIGLTPASRKKLKIAIGGTEDDDGSGEFI